MPRDYKRKTDSGLVPHEKMLEAVEAVERGEGSLRGIAKQHGISKSALSRYIAKHKENPPAKLAPNYRHSQVLNQKMETNLADFLKCSMG